jgi:hypothetical protein
MATLAPACHAEASGEGGFPSMRVSQAMSIPQIPIFQRNFPNGMAVGSWPVFACRLRRDKQLAGGVLTTRPDKSSRIDRRGRRPLFRMIGFR